MVRLLVALATATLLLNPTAAFAQVPTPCVPLPGQAPPLPLAGDVVCAPAQQPAEMPSEEATAAATPAPVEAAPVVASTPPANYNPSGPDQNCNEFPQPFTLPGGEDPHDLDRNNDGIACNDGDSATTGTQVTQVPVGAVAAGTAPTPISLVIAVAALVLAGCGSLVGPSTTQREPEPAAVVRVAGAPVVPAPMTAATQVAPVAQPPEGVIAPMAIRIPSLGLEAGLVFVGLNDDRTMQVPGDPNVAGWYVHSPSPGDLGPAVVVGHVAPRPAVFSSLERLAPGDLIEVTRADGGVATFAVQRTERHDKDAFPTAAVYGDTLGSELRLITCGGAYDPLTRHYADNLIVFATAV